MNTPTPPSTGPDVGPPLGDERSCLELMLRLQPFPCLVVETDTARAVLSNDAARRMLIDRPRGPAGPGVSYATDAAGERIEPEAVIPYLVGRDAGGDGVELTRHAPGDRRYFRVASQELPPKDGMVPLSVLTFLDYTGQKVAEDELRDAIEARDEFFSVATHELKDPLFSLQLSIQLLRHTAERQGPVPAHVLQHLEVSERQVARLGHLIDNMLDIARIVNGRFELDLETLDLCDLAHQVVARFQGQASTNGTTLIAEPCPAIVGRFDRLRVEQVLGNLLSNAIKYGAGKPVVVRVRGDGRWAVIEVEDAGAGIAPEDQLRIFERFERASSGHKRASLGLGLYIVRSLVEAHGGSVGLRSQPGRGSTFTVRIPWEPPPASPRTPAPRGPARPEEDSEHEYNRGQRTRRRRPRFGAERRSRGQRHPPPR
jgi:signal transduction histidine kinase